MSVIWINHVVVLVFIGFSSIQRGMLLFITRLCIILVLTGMVYPRKNNFNMSPPGAVSEFESKSRLEFMCTFFVVSIRLRFIYLYDI